MDNSIVDIIALFDPRSGKQLDDEIVERLKNVVLDDDQRSDLYEENKTALNNWNDKQTYLDSLEFVTRRKVLLQRLMGLPEDPMPESDIVPPESPKNGNPPPAKKAVGGLARGDLNNFTLDDEAPELPVNLPKANPQNETESPRHIALRHLFHPTSKEFSQADVDVIGQSWRLKKEDAKFLTPDVRGQIALFVGQVDEGDNEGYVDGIDEVTRPDLTGEERERLKQLLRQLLKHTETNRPVQRTAPTTTKFVGDPIKLNFDVPNWIRVLHTEPRWKHARLSVELAFTESQSTDPEQQLRGQTQLAAWKRFAKECKEKCCGPNLVPFGEQLYKLVRSLEGGADPTSYAYQVFFINT